MDPPFGREKLDSMRGAQGAWFIFNCQMPPRKARSLASKARIAQQQADGRPLQSFRQDSRQQPSFSNSEDERDHMAWKQRPPSPSPPPPQTPLLPAKRAVQPSIKILDCMTAHLEHLTLSDQGKGSPDSDSSWIWSGGSDSSVAACSGRHAATSSSSKRSKLITDYR